MAIDLTKITTKYKGKWVGLQPKTNTVIASGKTVKDVMEKSKEKGCNKPILFKVPSKNIPYVGCVIHVL